MLLMHSHGWSLLTGMPIFHVPVYLVCPYFMFPCIWYAHISCSRVSGEPIFHVPVYLVCPYFMFQCFWYAHISCSCVSVMPIFNVPEYLVCPYFMFPCIWYAHISCSSVSLCLIDWRPLTWLPWRSLTTRSTLSPSLPRLIPSPKLNYRNSKPR